MRIVSYQDGAKKKIENFDSWKSFCADCIADILAPNWSLGRPPTFICTCCHEYDTTYIHERRGTCADNWWGRETKVDDRTAQENIYFCVLPLATEKCISDLLSSDSKYGAVC